MTSVTQKCSAYSTPSTKTSFKSVNKQFGENMKKILFCLLVAMQYASANSCTGLLYQFLSESYLVPNAEIQLDSVFVPKESIARYSYSNGKIKSNQIYSYKEESTTDFNYYWYQNPSALTKTSYEYLMKDSSSADTTYIFEDFYGYGTLGYQRTIKFTANSMQSLIKNLDFGVTEYTETILTGDSIVHKIYKGVDRESELASTTVYVSDSSDTKCYEASPDGDTISTITYSSSENNYSLQVKTTGLTAYYYYTSTKQETTSIHQRNNRITTIPKRRSFDALGRSVNKKSPLKKNFSEKPF